MKLSYVMPLVAFALFATVNCSSNGSSGSSAAVEDSSASGAVASSIGGALGGSSSTGTVSMSHKTQTVASLFSSVAHADTQLGALAVCPTIVTGCAQSGANANMVYSACSFGSSGAVWNGTLQASLAAGTTPTTTITCGTFPAPTAGTLNRQFMNGTNPGTATRTSVGGVTTTIDDATANLNNFDKANTTISANIGTGYGSEVAFAGSKRTGVTVDERVYSSTFDHSITGSVVISESGGTRSIQSGSMTVYHNLLRLIGTTTFSGVEFNDSCCTPVQGTITTSYAAAASGHVQPTTAGNLLVGATETLTITGCGTGTLSINGLTANVILRGCY